MNSDQATIRREMKSARLALSPAERQHANRALTKNLLRLRAIRRCSTIGAYLPFRGEADFLQVLENQILRKKRVFLPVLKKNRLRFVQLYSDSELRKNRYGILEPVYTNADLINTRDLDIILAPLVAFDADCNRIGMGGGYYDRTLAFRKPRKNWRRPLLIGVAYDFQRVESVETQPWDIPLDAVITDKQCYGLF